jgi:hypothetical protein
MPPLLPSVFIIPVIPGGYQVIPSGPSREENKNFKNINK